MNLTQTVEELEDIIRNYITSVLNGGKALKCAI